MMSAINEQQQGNSLPVNPLTASNNKKRSVSFNPTVRVKKTLHINNYTPAEIANTWCSHEEEQVIRETAIMVAEMMASGKSIDETKISRRGLEGRTVEGLERRLQQRIAVWDAVLDQQADNIGAGIVDDELIAMASRALTFKSQIAANIVGSLDEQTVQEMERPAFNASAKSMGGNNSRRSTIGHSIKSPTPASRIRVRKLSCRAA